MDGIDFKIGVCDTFGMFTLMRMPQYLAWIINQKIQVGILKNVRMGTGKKF